MPVAAASRLLTAATPSPKKGGRRLPYQNILDTTPLKSATRIASTPSGTSATPNRTQQVTGRNGSFKDVVFASRSPAKKKQSAPAVTSSASRAIAQVEDSSLSPQKKRRRPSSRSKTLVPETTTTSDILNPGEQGTTTTTDFTRLRDILGGNILQETQPVREVLMKPDNSKAVQEKRKAAALLAKRLLLPSSYEALNSMFCAIEMLLRAKKCRGREFVGFEELRTCVEGSCHLRFDRKELAQILFVDPSAYDVDVFVPHSDFQTQNSPQLKISVKSTGPQSLEEPFSNADLLSRRAKFRRRLEEITNDYHQKFLATLDVAELALNTSASISSSSPSNSSTFLTASPASSSTSAIDSNPTISSHPDSTSSGPTWHPLFDVETLPGLPEAYLPPTEPALPSASRLFFATAASASPTTTSSPAIPAIVASLTADGVSAPPRELTGSLNGLDAEYVAKIYAKDAARRLDIAQGGPQHRQRCDSQVRLLGLAVALRAHLGFSRRPIVPLKELARETMHLSGDVEQTQEFTESQLRALCEEVPEWCSIQEVAKMPVFKCDIKANFVPIHQKLKDLQKRARAQRSCFEPTQIN